MAGTPQIVTVTDLIPIASASQALVTTTASTTTTPWGFSTQTQADGIVALVNALQVALVDAGIIKGGV